MLSAITNLYLFCSLRNVYRISYSTQTHNDLVTCMTYENKKNNISNNKKKSKVALLVE